MLSNYLDIDWLKNNHQFPIHYFGLGFIQLKLNQYERMHFYTSNLPPIIGEEDVHNHRYNFTSKILKGTFGQKFYQMIAGSSHVLEEESCKEGHENKTEGILCGLLLTSSHTYTVGSEYYVNDFVFHRVTATNCITLVKRGNYTKELAEVIRPLGVTKVCPFSKKIEEKILWELVEDLINNF